MKNEFFYATGNDYDSEIRIVDGIFQKEVGKIAFTGEASGKDYLLYESFISNHYIAEDDVQDWMKGIFCSTHTLRGFGMMSVNWKDLIKAKKYLTKRHIEYVKDYLYNLESQTKEMFTTKKG